MDFISRRLERRHGPTGFSRGPARRGRRRATDSLCAQARAQFRSRAALLFLASGFSFLSPPTPTRKKATTVAPAGGFGFASCERKCAAGQ